MVTLLSSPEPRADYPPRTGRTVITPRRLRREGSSSAGAQTARRHWIIFQFCFAAHPRGDDVGDDRQRHTSRAAEGETQTAVETATRDARVEDRKSKDVTTDPRRRRAARRRPPPRPARPSARTFSRQACAGPVTTSPGAVAFGRVRGVCSNHDAAYLPPGLIDTSAAFGLAFGRHGPRATREAGRGRTLLGEEAVARAAQRRVPSSRAHEVT